MSNLMVCFSNRADIGSYSGGSWYGGLPLTNLKLPEQWKPARSTDATLANTKFTIDFGRFVNLRAFALANHNLSQYSQWRVRVWKYAPTVDIPFEDGVWDSRITFTRAGSAYRTNASGVLELMATNVPRIDYDPVTLAWLGLLLEGPATNLMPHSADFTNAVWAKNTAGSATAAVVTANYAAAPDGTTTADRVVFARSGSAAGDYSLLIGSPSVPGTSYYTRSIWMKSNTGVNQTVVLYGIGAGVVLTVTPTWQRFTLTDSDTSYAPFAFGTRGGTGYFAGGQTSIDISVWGAQLEEGTGATSYTPTTTGTATRAADVPSMSGTNLTSWFNPAEGTVYTEFSASKANPSGNGVFGFNAGSGSNVIGLYGSSSVLVADAYVGGVLNAYTNVTSAFSAGTTKRAAVAYKANDFGLSVGGSAASVDTSCALPTITILSLGNIVNAGTPYLFGHLKRFAYYHERLPDAELTDLSADGTLSSVYDSAWQAVWHLTFGSEMLEWGDVSFWEGVLDDPSEYIGHPYLATHSLPAPVNARYATVEINDTANPDGYVQIGRLFAGSGFQPRINAAYGLKDRWIDDTEKFKSSSGYKLFKKKRRRRATSFALEWLSHTEAAIVHEIQRRLGISGEVLYLPDPADQTYNQRYGMIGHMEELSAIDYPKYNNRSAGFSIEEF